MSKVLTLFHQKTSWHTDPLPPKKKKIVPKNYFIDPLPPLTDPLPPLTDPLPPLDGVVCQRLMDHETKTIVFKHDSSK